MKIPIKYKANVADLLEDDASFYGFSMDNLRIGDTLLRMGLTKEDMDLMQSNILFVYDMVLRHFKEQRERAIKDIENNVKAWGDLYDR